MIYYE